MNLRKKNSRQRGSHTHGWGAKKKHRGAGHRGGRGAAGSGKRGDAKKPSIWKLPVGKRGFKPQTGIKPASITLAHLETYKKTLIKEGYLTIREDEHIINLEEAGYYKLLGTGNTKTKWSVTTSAATSSAIEKIKNAGGTVTLTQQSEGEEQPSERGEETTDETQ